MNAQDRCPECGVELPANAPRGLCPACLLKAGLKTQTAVGGEVPDADRTPPTPAELAACFPDLEILEFIGRGGMGMVYKARQIHLNRLVALKILSPKIASDPAFAERFNREAQAMALLSHPHVVVVHDFGRCDFPANSVASPLNSKSEVLGQASTPSVPSGKGTEGAGQLYYFLMEYVDGLNLRQLLDAGKLLPKQALAIVPQICEALQYAHDHGVVHRDIKPENILIDKAGQVKIADFGLAKLVGRGAKTADRPEEAPQNAPPADPTLTAAGQVMGTPYYMAPEQTEHPKEVDHRADIYSLGVVFYQMLTGELPIGRFAPPSKKVEIDVRLDEVVLRALEKEPSRRYQHVSEIKTRIETINSDASSAESLKASGTALEPRFSKAAIVGAIWSIAFFLLLIPIFYFGLQAHAGDKPEGPSIFGVLLWMMLPFGVLAPFGTTILGAVSLSQIRHSAGRLYGLGLALFDTLLFPLLLLDAIIGGCIYYLLNWWVHSTNAAGPSNIQAVPEPSAVLMLTVIVSLLVDIPIVIKAWKAACTPIDNGNSVKPNSFQENEPLPSGTPSSGTPRLLNASKCKITTPERLAAFGEQFLFLLKSGHITLDERQLTITQDGGMPTEIPLAAIEDLGIGIFPRIMNPYGIDFIGLTYNDRGMKKRLILAPYDSPIGSPPHFNRIVAEWHQAIRDAATAATGHAPGVTPAKLLRIRSSWVPAMLLIPLIPLLFCFFMLQGPGSQNIHGMTGLIALAIGGPILVFLGAMIVGRLARGRRKHIPVPDAHIQSADTSSSTMSPSLEAETIQSALRQVQAPAIGLLVLGILHSLVFLPLLAILLPAFQAAASAANRAGAAVEWQIIPLLFPALWILECVLIIVAGVKMKQLRAYGLAVTASILTFICLNPLGIAIGIWALVVLSQQDVRNAFWVKSRQVVPNLVPLKARRLGLAALLLCLLGIPISVILTVLIGVLFGGMPLSRAAVFLPLILFQLVALICGILGRKSGTGVAATILSSIFLLISIPLFGLFVVYHSYRQTESVAASEIETICDIAQQPDGPWLAKLPQGSIELVAVSYNPSEGKPWWRPDGSPCDEGPFTNKGTRSGESKTTKAREFVARMRDLPGGSSWPVWKIDRSEGLADGGICQPNCSLVTASLPKTDRIANLQIGVATGDWQTIDVIDPKHGHAGSGRLGDSIVNVTVPRPIQTIDAQVIVAVAFSKIEADIRLIAVDGQGGEIYPSRVQYAGSGNSLNQMTVTFPKLPLTQVKEFRFQGRSYQWVEFRNVMLEPTAGEAASSETTKPEESVASLGAAIEKMDIENATGPWIVTLPQSKIEVEMLGVSENPSKEKPWWKPDGSPLPERPYDEWGMGFRAGKETNGKHEKKYPGQVEREFAVQMHNLPEEPVGDRWDVRDSGYGGFSRKNGQVVADIRSLAVSLPGDAKKTSLRFGVAAGPWKNEMETNGLLQYPSSGRATFSGVKEQEKDAVITVSHQITLPETRVIAIDQEGKEHKSEIVESSGGYSGIQQVTVKFPGLTLKEISKVVLQSRPYEWVEFRNVALEPKSGEKAPSSDKAESSPSPKDSAIFGPIHTHILFSGTPIEGADLDRGVVIPMPEEEKKACDNNEGRAFRWFAEQGVDLFVADQGMQSPGFVATLDLSPVKGEIWDKASAADVQAALDSGEIAPQLNSLGKAEGFTFYEIKPDAVFPMTFAFKTPAGGKGLLQLVSRATQNSKISGLSIRYKKLLGGPSTPERAKYPPSSAVEQADAKRAGEEPAAAFGPVIERLLTDPSYLDADTDLAISGLDVKPAELEAQKEAVKKGEIVPPWMRERGIDFFVGSSLAGVDIDMIELTGDGWKNISPDGLKETLASLRRAEPPKFSYPISELGSAFGFRTREGGIGILQITGKTKSQQGESIMIRYKLALKPVPAEAAAFYDSMTEELEVMVNAMREAGHVESMKSLPSVFEPKYKKLAEMLKGTVAEIPYTELRENAIVWANEINAEKDPRKQEAKIQEMNAKSNNFRSLIHGTTPPQPLPPKNPAELQGPKLVYEIDPSQTPAEKNEAKQEAETPVAVFGPIHTHILFSATKEFVEGADLDEGVVIPMPEEEIKAFDKDESRAFRWLVEHGVDLFVAEQGMQSSAVAAKLDLSPLKGEIWDKASAADVQTALDSGEIAPQLNVLSKGEGFTFYEIKQDAVFPMTFAFKTPAGGKGLLQIVSLASQNSKISGLSIRYKKLLGGPSTPENAKNPLSSTDEKADAKPAVESAASFGPEIDRLLTDPSYLDADTDLAISGLDVKPAELEAQKEAVKKGEIVPPWMRERGIDFFVGSSLAGVDIDMIELTGDGWKNISPDGLKEKIASLRRTEPPKFSYPITELGTFGFRTREGGIGIVQITGKYKSHQSESIIIRYKMISGTTKSPPLPQKTEPSGEIPADNPAEPVETEAK